jgi:hypothetical protein
MLDKNPVPWFFSLFHYNSSSLGLIKQKSSFLIGMPFLNLQSTSLIPCGEIRVANAEFEVWIREVAFRGTASFEKTAKRRN